MGMTLTTCTRAIFARTNIGPLKDNIPIMPLLSGPIIDKTLHREKETTSDNAAIQHLLHYYANASTDISRKQRQEGAHPDAPQWTNMLGMLCSMNGVDCVVEKHL